MTTIGDVFAIIAALIGLGLTTWALLVSCALLCPRHVKRAWIASETSIRTNLAVGIFMLLPSLVGLIFLGNPHPVLKGIGAVILLVNLSLVAIGAAGLGYIAGDQISKMDPSIGEYPAFLRGSGFLVTASMLPILGWFVFGPIIILASLGGGLRAVTGKIPNPAPPVIADPLIQ
jgi:hypothetical protein